MAKKEKKISVSELEKAIGDIRPAQTEIEWNGLKILVKDMLTLEEMMSFVEAASDLCFGEGDAYRPEVREFGIRYNIIGMYTNLRLPESTEKTYQIVYTDGLIDSILQNVNREQYEDILCAIDLKVRERVQYNHATAKKETEELIRSVAAAVETFGTIFDGVDSDQIHTIVAAMAEGGVDEEKIVKAYMNARRDVETHGDD